MTFDLIFCYGYFVSQLDQNRVFYLTITSALRTYVRCFHIKLSQLVVEEFGVEQLNNHLPKFWNSPYVMLKMHV